MTSCSTLFDALGPVACTHIEDLIKRLAAVPGIGSRSAIRAVAHMLNYRDIALNPICTAITRVNSDVKRCELCWNHGYATPCDDCSGSNKHNGQELCIVEHIGALWSIERSKHYNGMYHILGGLLSAADGTTAAHLNIANLLRRIVDRNHDKPLEIIIAIPPSISSGITIEYLISAIRSIDQTVVISKVAQGLPSGIRIDAVDDETMVAAFMSRMIVG